MISMNHSFIDVISIHLSFTTLGLIYVRHTDIPLTYFSSIKTSEADYTVSKIFKLQYSFIN